MRVYGLRGWVKTCSSSSNQALIAPQSRRTCPATSAIAPSSYSSPAPAAVCDAVRTSTTAASPRLGERSVRPVGSSSATTSSTGR